MEELIYNFLLHRDRDIPMDSAINPPHLAFINNYIDKTVSRRSVSQGDSLFIRDFLSEFWHKGEKLLDFAKLCEMINLYNERKKLRTEIYLKEMEQI